VPFATSTICSVPTNPSGEVAVTVTFDAFAPVSAHTRPPTDASFCTATCDGSLTANLKVRTSMFAPFESVERR
jgi:hypothetical protein